MRVLMILLLTTASALAQNQSSMGMAPWSRANGALTAKERAFLECFREKPWDARDWVCPSQCVTTGQCGPDHAFGTFGYVIIH